MVVKFGVGQLGVDRANFTFGGEIWFDMCVLHLKSADFVLG